MTVLPGIPLVQTSSCPMSVTQGKVGVSSNHGAIVVACASDHAYFCGLVVTLHSLCSTAVSAGALRLHVFDAGLTPEDLAVLEGLPGRFPGRTIHILRHVLDVSAYKTLPVWRNSHVAYARLTLQDLLPEEDFVIYTDVDTLWLRDISELWALRSDQYLLWAVPDGSGLRYYSSGDSQAAALARLGSRVRPEEYFCSGLLMMNLRRLREEGFTARCAEALQRFGERLAFPDQDLYNLLCPPPETCLLDPMWGEFSAAYGLRGTEAARVIHYANAAPWKRKRPTAVGLLWWTWLTDHVGFETLGHEAERFRKLYTNVQCTLQHKRHAGLFTRYFCSHKWWKYFSNFTPEVREKGNYAFPRRLRGFLNKAWGLRLPERILRPTGTCIVLEPGCDLSNAGTCEAPLEVGYGSQSASPLRRVQLGRWAKIGAGVSCFGSEKAAPVRIGHGAEVGDGASLAYGISLGEGAWVEPGAQVMNDVKPYNIVSGNPAREVGSRAIPEVEKALAALHWWTYDLTPLGGRELLTDPSRALETLRVALERNTLRELAPEVVTEDLLAPYCLNRQHWVSFRKRQRAVCLFGQWLTASPLPLRRWAKVEGEERISISFCISDDFAQHLTVVAASLLEHTPGRAFVFHVLAKTLSNETRRKLAQMETDWSEKCRFVFHAVDRSRFDAFPLPLEHITQEMYYRYLLPEMLPEERRTLYLDVDVLALGDISPLWELDLGECLLAGVPDGKKDTLEWRDYRRRLGLKEEAIYVNSGVLLMDLERLRPFNFGAKCMEATGRLHDRIAWPDQDVINLITQGRILPLPNRWNCTTPRSLPRGDQPIIRHFASFSSKPWCCLWKNRTWPIYLRFLLKTPYRDRAGAFVLAHLRGLFWFRYVKKGIERTVICGVLMRKRRIVPEKGVT